MTQQLFGSYDFVNHISWSIIDLVYHGYRTCILFTYFSKHFEYLLIKCHIDKMPYSATQTDIAIHLCPLPLSSPSCPSHPPHHSLRHLSFMPPPPPSLHHAIPRIPRAIRPHPPSMSPVTMSTSVPPRPTHHPVSPTPFFTGHHEPSLLTLMLAIMSPASSFSCPSSHGYRRRLQ